MVSVFLSGQADPALNKHEEKMFESVPPMEEKELESDRHSLLTDISHKVGDVNKEDEAKGSVEVGGDGGVDVVVGVAGGDRGAVVIVGSSEDGGRVVVVVSRGDEVGVVDGRGDVGVVVAGDGGVEGVDISCFFLRYRFLGRSTPICIERSCEVRSGVRGAGGKERSSSRP